MKGADIMNRQTATDLERLYEEVKKPMTVGTVKPGELEGKTKEKGPKKSGAECTDAKKGTDAPKELQGDTVDSSTGKKQTVKESKKMSKFDELYSQAIQEDAAPGIEDKSFDSDIGDFPPAGGDEASAEEALGDEEIGGDESLAELFTSFADIASKIATKFQEKEGAEEAPEMIDDGGEVPPMEDIAKEAVESKPAPDGVAKLTAKGAMDVKAVTVSKQSASTKSGAGADGKLSVAKDTTLGPKTPLKAPGTGSISTGKDTNFFG